MDSHQNARTTPHSRAEIVRRIEEGQPVRRVARGRPARQGPARAGTDSGRRR
jgi:hypothetical protein